MSVDRELLADYLGGALAGTPDEARVAGLIAAEPAWATAAAELAEALTQVTAGLDGVAELPAPSMPPEIVDRLDRALADAPALVAAGGEATGGEAGGASPVGPHPGRPGRRDEARRDEARRDEARRHPPGHPGQRPRRRPGRRVGAGFAAAAGVVAFAAVGVGAWQLGQSPTATDDSVSAPAAEQPTVDDTAPHPLAARPELLVSGRDYQPDPRQLTPPAAPGPDAEGGPLEQSEGPNIASDGAPAGAVPPALDRLWSDPQARASCLEQVTAAVSPAPATVEVLDFAQVEGDPAVVIWVTAGDGTHWAWAVGPGCGSSTAGLDEVFQLRIS
ncbi:hypothetical protein JQS43_25800 [Natronosporangium hydrolyticum]|uniref:Anti-sigma factor n=1 Tax=Natronosporangium hydrolyticum TaxID=2811111 RepID=A0A895YHF5_9ACTN|nr:hypothetical protein [Natronosporangium hydrolyticum]QSB14813.1 hypothetical protein JQS43_25800 [Natronosporangium hydrolyticum]